MKTSTWIITTAFLAGALLAACGGGAAPASNPPTSAPVAGNSATSASATNTARTSDAATRTSNAAATSAARTSDTGTSTVATRVAIASNAAATATSVAASRPAASKPAAPKPTVAPTPVLPPAMSTATGQPVDTSGTVPLSAFQAMLLLVHQFPQLASDDALLPFVTAEVRREAQAWKEVDCFTRLDPACSNSVHTAPDRLNPTRSTFILEWQKDIDQQPDLARGALLDIFLRPDADWSFVRREPGWDDSFDNLVQVFIFSHDGVVGREPDFAARELLPVFRRHLEAAVSRAAMKFWFNVQLPAARYDFPTSGFRFSSQSTSTLAEKYDILHLIDPTYLASLPTETRDMANYSIGTPTVKEATAQTLNGLRLRVPVQLVPMDWRTMMDNPGNRLLPPIGTLSLNHQLQVTSLPVDPARAEALTKKGANFVARVYVAVDRVLTFNFQPASSTTPQAALVARIQKVDVVARAAGASQLPGATDPSGPDEELVASFV